jgi:hypothetical protein
MKLWRDGRLARLLRVRVQPRSRGFLNRKILANHLNDIACVRSRRGL